MRGTVLRMYLGAIGTPDSMGQAMGPRTWLTASRHLRGGPGVTY